MFLKKLYHHSKLTFAVFILFTGSFIFLNLKWGAVATPAYQFGMFSGSMHRADTQKIIQFYINNDFVDPGRYTLAKRDLLLVTLQQYEKEKETNAAVFNSMKKIFSYVGAGTLMKEKVFTNNTSDVLFTRYYLKMLQDIVGYPVLKAEIFSQKYTWHSGKMKPVSSPEKLKFIVAEP